MARLALILHDGSPGWRENRLARILDFFGVPSKMVEAHQLKERAEGGSGYCVFGSIRNVASTLKQRQSFNPPAAYYLYLDDAHEPHLSELQSLFGCVSHRQAPTGSLSLQVAGDQADLTGPMAGLKFPLQLGNEDTVLTVTASAGEPSFTTVIWAENSPVFLRFQHESAPVFLCTSSRMVNIDEPVRGRYYDVKDHFCSVVPLVMFIRFMYPGAVWQPQELGACLIIDDPLLKPKYGFCNFAELRNLMQRLGFTTNIAFIPWNWRRTTPDAGKFFDFDSGLFSVSVHGCDHTAGEFAATSPDVLEASSRLARLRMRNHEIRTGIKHDPVMVFPQGAFSSICPEILKRNGFLAAVNTEIAPTDFQNSRTRIQDVWDVAIRTYGDFPIFTRRYAFHGLENFAFDLLLGKPCLIVAHHDFFKDDGLALIDLIEKLGSLNCRLQWRPLGQVIRRACRRRATGPGEAELEMYGGELLVDNPTDQSIAVKIRKRKSLDDSVSEILCEGKPVLWENEGEHFVFGGKIGPHSEKCFRAVPAEKEVGRTVRRPLRFELAVAARRILSELRDNYLSTSSFLSVPAEKFKNAVKRTI